MGGGRSQCTSGISSNILNDDNVLITAPGADYWQGTVDFLSIPPKLDTLNSKPKLFQGPIYNQDTKPDLFNLNYTVPKTLRQKYKEEIIQNLRLQKIQQEKINSKASYISVDNKEISDEDIENAVSGQVQGFLLANTWDNNLAGYSSTVFKNRLQDKDDSLWVALGSPKRFQFDLKGAVSFRKVGVGIFFILAWFWK